jgi:heme exporter protein CcmD
LEQPEMPEFLVFGKHTAYVVSSFALVMVVLAGNVLFARRRLRILMDNARRRMAAEEQS